MTDYYLDVPLSVRQIESYVSILGPELANKTLAGLKSDVKNLVIIIAIIIFVIIMFYIVLKVINDEYSWETGLYIFLITILVLLFSVIIILQSLEKIINDFYPSLSTAFQETLQDKKETIENTIEKDSCGTLNIIYYNINADQAADVNNITNPIPPPIC